MQLPRARPRQTVSYGAPKVTAAAEERVASWDLNAASVVSSGFSHDVSHGTPRFTANRQVVKLSARF